MKAIKLVVKNMFVACALSFGLQAQTYQNDFQKNYVIDEGPVINKTLTKTEDGGYFMATMYEGNNLPNSEDAISFFKLKSDFTIDWEIDWQTSTIGYGAMLTANDAIQTEDGGYVICGRKISEGGFMGSYVMKLDSNGSFVWFKQYPYQDMYDIYSIVETPKGFIAVGTGSTGYKIGVMMGLNAVGDVSWNKTFEDTNDSYYAFGYNRLVDVIKIDDENYVAVGNSNFDGVQWGNITVVKTDLNGNVSAYWNYGRQIAKGYGYTAVASAVAYDKNDETLVLVGNTTKKEYGICLIPDYSEILVKRIDYNSGAIIWSNRYDIDPDQDSANWATDVVLNEDHIGVSAGMNGKVMSGSANSYDAVIMDLKNDGGVDHIRAYGDGNADYLHKIVLSDDGNYVAGGYNAYVGKNSPWIVESYTNILDWCKSEPLEYNFVEDVFKQYESDVKEMEISYEDAELTDLKLKEFTEEICEKVEVSTNTPCVIGSVNFSSADAPGFNYAKSFTPTVTTNSTTSIVSWSWSYGDGNSGTGANGYNNYVNAGYYEVCLTVTGVSTTGAYCEKTFCKTIAAGPVMRKAQDAVSYTTAYPNPFTASTTIGFDVVNDGNQVRLDITDMSGRIVSTLVNETNVSKGNHQIEFDAAGLKKGVYFYRLNINGATSIHRLVLQ